MSYVSYRPHSGTIFSVNYTQAKTTPTIVEESDAISTAEHQKWGDSDSWPVDMRLRIQKSTTANPLAIKAACMMFGNGVTYFKEVRTTDGIQIDYSAIPEIDEFFENNDIDRIMMERLIDYKTYGNVFCEFLIDITGTGVQSIYHKEAEFCRFGRIVGEKVQNILYSSSWSESKVRKSIGFVHKYDQKKDLILKKYKGPGRFVTHDCLPSAGSTLYALPMHSALAEKDGWLEFAISIPKLMNAINKNGLNLRYHIEIPSDYWLTIDPSFDTLDKDQKSAIMESKFQEMDDFLKGVDNAGGVFISHFAVDPVTKQSLPGWKITTLDDKFKKDQFLTSIQEADTQIARSFGVDLSLAGIQAAGGKMGAGSGSDKRVGFENSINMSKAEQLVILAPLFLVKKLNDWPTNVRFAFSHDVATSLNENKEGVKTIN